jgi:hypothetical protein
MYNLTLIDSVALLFILYRVLRAHKKPFAESIQGLISITLIVSLLMGFRISAEIRQLISNMAGFMDMAPGIAGKILIIFLAWYLVHLLRSRPGNWLAALFPLPVQRPLIRWLEAARALVFFILLVWIIEGWYAPDNPNSPLIIKAVRQGNAWITVLTSPSGQDHTLQKSS